MQNQFRDYIVSLQDVLLYVTATLTSVTYVDPYVTELCVSFHVSHPILPNNNTSPILLCIRNTRFQFYVLVSREGLNTLREICVLAYVIGTVFSLNLKNSCAEYISSNV